MSLISVRLVRLALLYLVAGFTIGGLLLAAKGLGDAAWLDISAGLTLMGRLCEIGAMGALAYHIWPRVRAFKG